MAQMTVTPQTSRPELCVIVNRSRSVGSRVRGNGHRSQVVGTVGWLASAPTTCSG